MEYVLGLERDSCDCGEQGVRSSALALSSWIAGSSWLPPQLFKNWFPYVVKGSIALGGLQGLWCVFQGAVIKVLQIHQKRRISNMEVTMISSLRETNCRSCPWTEKTSSGENGGLFIGVKKQSPQWYLNGDCSVKMHLCQNCTENSESLQRSGRNMGVAFSIYIVVTFYLLRPLLVTCGNN